MKLRDFLLKKTNAHELCVIRRGGWIIATAWIDSEDLFEGHLDRTLGDMIVKGDKWGYLPIVNENDCGINIPCHYIDV